MIVKLLGLEDLRSFHHVIDQWDRSLREQSVNDSSIVEVEVHDMEIHSPHPWAYMLLVVEELSDASECLICVILAGVRECDTQGLFENFLELRVKLWEFS